MDYTPTQTSIISLLQVGKSSRTDSPEKHAPGQEPRLDPVPSGGRLPAAHLFVGVPLGGVLHKRALDDRVRALQEDGGFERHRAKRGSWGADPQRVHALAKARRRPDGPPRHGK